jgi:hypothetical protein
MAQAWPALNTYIYVLDTSVSPQPWNKIALVDDIEGPKIKRTVIDVTTHDTQNGYVQKLPSLKDAQQVMLTMLWDPTDPSHDESGYTSVKTMLEDGIIRQFKITYPVSPPRKQTFAGFVVAYEPSSKVKDALRLNVTIEVTDKATLTSGT